MKEKRQIPKINVLFDANGFNKLDSSKKWNIRTLKERKK